MSKEKFEEVIKLLNLWEKCAANEIKYATEKETDLRIFYHQAKIGIDKKIAAIQG